MTLQPDSTRKYYEENAPAYFEQTYPVQLTPLWAKLADHLAPEARLLDLGCGSGRDVAYFSSRNLNPVGLDYSTNLIHLAQFVGARRLVVGDINHVPFAPQSFEAAWAIGSLLHLQRRAIPGVLSRVRVVLKQGGWFLSSVKKGAGAKVDSRGRTTVFYSVNEWRRLLEQAGFDLVEVEENVERRPVKPGTYTEIIWIVCLARAGLR